MVIKAKAHINYRKLPQMDQSKGGLFDWEPTEQQQNIFEEMVAGRTHLLARAGAGCAKSSTQLRGIYSFPESMRRDIAVYAFNREIADYLIKWVPPGVYCNTFHAAAFSILKRRCPGIQLDTRKSQNLLKKLFPGRLNYSQRCQIANLASVVKNSSVSFLTWQKSSQMRQLAEWQRYHGIPIPESHFEYVIELLNESIDCQKQMDFDDMLWMPMVQGWRPRQYRYVMVDEAQDLNKVQQLFAFNSLAPDGKLIVVGDPMQSIYGFRGADADSIPSMTAFLEENGGCVQLPLSITMRCPKSVVELANELVTDFHARPDAAEGRITTKSQEMIAQLAAQEVDEGGSALIMGRRNAPLVELLFELWQRGIKARKTGDQEAKRIEGYFKRQSDGKGIVKMREMALADERAELKLLENQEVEERHLENCRDRWTVVHKILEEAESRRDALEIVKEMYAKHPDQVLLSTVHRAKGLEASFVGILEPWLMPHPLARQKWEQRQEENIAYVAVTRLKGGGELAFEGKCPTVFPQAAARLTSLAAAHACENDDHWSPSLEY